MGKGDGACGPRPPMTLDVPPAETPTMDQLRTEVAAGAGRVAQLGDWPAWISPESLTDRVPQPGQRNASGFDAGIACALNLIPSERQRLAARLHAAYTPAAVEQVRREAAAGFDPDADTTWWLAACSVCREGEIDEHGMLEQLRQFRRLAADPSARRAAARAEFEAMTSRFWIQDGVAYGVEDGCQQGAYIAGHRFAAMGPHEPQVDPQASSRTAYQLAGHAQRLIVAEHGLGEGERFSSLAQAAAARRRHGGDIWAVDPDGSLRLLTPDSGIYFVGTYEASLGLEDFDWGAGVPDHERVDEHGRERSGPVHGSKQFIKCATRAEYERVIAQVRRHLGD